MLKWSDDYKLGVDFIDEQHQNLLEIADRGHQLLTDNFRLDKYDEIVQIIEELRDYTIYHFQTEEKYMASIGYTKLLSHKVQHDDFVEKLNKVDLKAMDDNQDKYLLELLEFVSQWIVGHICKVDPQYTDPQYIRK